MDPLSKMKYNKTNYKGENNTKCYIHLRIMETELNYLNIFEDYYPSYTYPSIDNMNFHPLLHYVMFREESICFL